MSERSKAYFRDYWDAQASGLPSHFIPYRDVCKELRYYLEDGQKYRALELGCGNGDLYAHTRELFTDYVGVDFSTNNIRAFSDRFPDTRLVQADVTEYIHPEPRDLIFSVQVMQYLDYGQLETLLLHNLEMVGKNFKIAHVGFLDRKLRSLFLSGYLRPGINKSQFRNILKPTAYTLYEVGSKALHGAGRLGFWHSTDKIQDICEKIGLEYRITGSMTYRYRFNLLITGKRSSGRTEAS
jgi:SAM-dependent methyltransferase